MGTNIHGDHGKKGDPVMVQLGLNSGQWNQAVREQFVLRTALSRSPKSKWHNGQRRFNEMAKCIREYIAF